VSGHAVGKGSGLVVFGYHKAVGGTKTVDPWFGHGSNEAIYRGWVSMGTVS
jgi:hypothetical protein